MLKITFFIFLQILLAKSEEPTTLSDSVVNDVSFIKIGTYRGFTDEGAEYQKTYFISRYMKNTWGEARAICKSFDLELATMETLAEAKSFLSMADNNSYFRSFTSLYIVLIDGTALTAKSPTDWYWSKSGRKISFPIPWYPGEPNNSGGSEYCLSFGRANASAKFGYVDVPCSQNIYQFVCQRLNIFVP